MYAPEDGGVERHRLHVKFNGEIFILSTNDGSYSKESNVTETEDVSYVSSPFLPACEYG